MLGRWGQRFGGIDGALYALQIMLLVSAPIYVLALVADGIWGAATTWTYVYENGQTVQAQPNETEEPQLVIVLGWLAAATFSLFQVALAMCLYCLRRIGGYLRDMNEGPADAH